MENPTPDTLNFNKASVNVLNLKLTTPDEFRRLKNCVGQINSTKELNKIIFINVYNIITTKISSKIV